MTENDKPGVGRRVCRTSGSGISNYGSSTLAGPSICNAIGPTGASPVLPPHHEAITMRPTNGTPREVAQATLTEIAASLDRLGCPNPSDRPSDIDIRVRRGQEAMSRHRRRFEDWLDIADAIDAGRSAILYRLGMNQPTGQRYQKAMGEWLIENGFREIADKGTRSRLLECLQHREAIMTWRAGLTDSERFRWNHPDSVLRWWKKKTQVPDPNAEPKKPSPVARLKESIEKLETENYRLRRDLERACDGDRWKPTDHARDIAQVVVSTFTPGKALDIARYIREQVKQKESSR
jgi:hypothetical protein